jgi:hypothetical protein
MSNERSRAKFDLAMEALKPLLESAHDAAHEDMADEDKKEELASRIHGLGWLMIFAGSLCGANVRVLADIAHALNELQDDDEPPRPRPQH